MTTVRDIVAAHLKSIGADGLCCLDCGCAVDNLFTCAWDRCCGDQCVPARFVPKAVATDDGDFHSKGDKIFVPMEQEPGR
jgi:hypothetical protein